VSNPLAARTPDAFLIALRDSALSLDEAWSHVAAPECGGQVFFVGSVRPDETPNGQISALEYEAYPGAAEKKMLEIAQDAVTKFGAMRVAMLHRYGHLSPGEAAVIIAVGCGHRAEAFEACRYVIDELKQRVPIWKKDWTASGPGSWAPGETGG